MRNQRSSRNSPAATMASRPAVGGAEHADVAGERLVVAHAADFPALQEPQQLRLHRLGQLADFVEEERAAVGHLEQSDAMLLGPGKRPLAMAEQLAFDQVLRQGAAVDRHQRHLRPQALIVQRPGDQFLAGARLAHHQHGRIGGGHLGDELADQFHARRVADQLGRAFQALEPLFQGAILVGQLALLRHPVEHRLQVGQLAGLGQVVEGPLPQGGHGRLQRRLAGEDDRLGVGGKLSSPGR